MTAYSNAKVIDLDTVRKQRQQETPAPVAPPANAAPMIVWVPVWVMVPQQPVPTY